MQTITEQDWQTLPEPVQQELYDFFLFLKQRYAQQRNINDDSETLAFSNHSANTVEEWLSEEEDEIWK